MIDQILEHKKLEVNLSKKLTPLPQLQRKVNELQKRPNHNHDFRASILKNGFSLIAEIKRKSPSHGEIRKNLCPKEIAVSYDRMHPVACISVLTDQKFFGGSLEDLQTVRQCTNKPLLRKEFILDEYQLYESVLGGADAALLISTLLEKEHLRDLIQVARALNLEPFIECHSKKDLEKIPFDDVKIVGINSRDLVGNLKTDLGVIPKIIKFIPQDKIIIAESGVHTSSDLKRMYDLGVHGVLIGAGILMQQDIEAAINHLMSEILVPGQN